MVQKSSIRNITVLWLFFIISTVGSSLPLAVQGKDWLARTEDNVPFLQREISHDINDTPRIGRREFGRWKSFKHLATKRDDSEEEPNEVKASSNLAGERDHRLYCRFRGKCNTGEKYKVSGFVAFTADYREPQRHPPRHNFMKRKHS